jgi:riboflavin kinase/FMN adenylyltransferase
VRTDSADSLGLPALACGSVVTVGTFDGVHRGHRDILVRLRERADAHGVPPLVVTFRPHPLEVVQPAQAPRLLTPGDEQLEALVDSGPLYVAVLPFTRALAAVGAEEFVLRFLVERYRARAIVVGYDHGLGRGREGDASALIELGHRRGFEVTVVPPTLDSPDGEPVSSTLVRNRMESADLVGAARALGRSYALRGAVVPGQRRGRDLGYPTLNVALPSPRKLLPPDGVYAVRVQTDRGTFGGMMNVGGRPTFGELERTIEAHLFDVDDNFYGASVSVELVRRLRGTERFDGVGALVAQLGRDAHDARIALTQA